MFYTPPTIYAPLSSTSIRTSTFSSLFFPFSTENFCPLRKFSGDILPEGTSWSAAEPSDVIGDPGELAVIRSSPFSSSALVGVTSSFLYFVRRFWNQILTWQSVTLSSSANSFLSADVRYFFSLKVFSSSHIWRPVNVVRAFFFFLTSAWVSGSFEAWLGFAFVMFWSFFAVLAVVFALLRMISKRKWL